MIKSVSCLLILLKTACWFLFLLLFSRPPLSSPVLAFCLNLSSRKWSCSENHIFCFCFESSCWVIVNSSGYRKKKIVFPSWQTSSPRYLFFSPLGTMLCQFYYCSEMLNTKSRTVSKSEISEVSLQYFLFKKHLFSFIYFYIKFICIPLSISFVFPAVTAI